MKLSKTQHEEPEINLTSLIDVVFLLLIFFMVSTTFERQAALKIDLPEASSEPSVEERERLEIVINEEGRYFVDGNELINTRSETLMDALSAAVGEDRDQPLTIRADARTPHQSVVTAMDAASQMGFVNLSIATTPAPDADQ